jgi:RecA-family ATPase
MNKAAAAHPILAPDEIPAAVEAEISAWWVKVRDAGDDALPIVLQDAAAALFATRKVNTTFYPECDNEVERTIQNELEDMAHYAVIGSDEAKQIFTRARREGPSKPAAAKKASVIANGHTSPIDAAPLPSPDDYGTAVIELPPTPTIPAALTTPSQWPQEAPAPVDWLARDRIPRGDVTTLHGDGGAGKTDIALRLAANVARGAPDWLGHEIASGRVIFISGEEPERDLQRRLWLHAQHDGYNFADLAELKLWFPGDDHDTMLATPERNSGIMRPTRLMHTIAAAVAQVEPVLVIVDNVAATFAGSQVDRVNARTYVNLWRAIARGPSKPAVLLLDHPSLSGLTSNTGRGGNMDWRNAVRAALYLHPAEDKAEADQGIRILETVKSNYGPPGRPLRLCWNDGGLQLEHAPSSLHRLAKDHECEETFLRLLDERSAQGRPVSDKSGKNYAPSIFADHAGAGGFTRQAFAKAMERLFQAKKIALRTMRLDGKSRQCIDRAG